jgi:hypothetical protein
MKDRIPFHNGNQYLHRKSPDYRNRFKCKMRAYHAFIQAGVVAQGLLQYLAIAAPKFERQRLSPCRRLTTLTPSHPVRHFWPLRNQRFFRLRSALLVERLGTQKRLTPFAFAVTSFLAE